MRYVDDADFVYQDFAKRGHTAEIPTFRALVGSIQEYIASSHNVVKQKAKGYDLFLVKLHSLLFDKCYWFVEKVAQRNSGYKMCGFTHWQLLTESESGLDSQMHQLEDCSLSCGQLGH